MIKKLPGPGRLDHVAISAGVEGPFHQLWIVALRHQDYGGIEASFDDLLGQSHRLGAAGVDVAEDQLKALVGKHPARLLDTARERAHVALAQRALDYQPRLGLVVGDEHTRQSGLSGREGRRDGPGISGHPISRGKAESGRDGSVTMDLRASHHGGHRFDPCAPEAP